MSTHVTLMNHLHLTSYVRKKNHLQDPFGKIRPWNVCCVSCTHNRDGIIFLFLMRKRCPIFAGPWIAGVNFHGTALFSEQISQLLCRRGKMTGDFFPVRQRWKWGCLVCCPIFYSRTTGCPCVVVLKLTVEQHTWERQVGKVLQTFMITASSRTTRNPCVVVFELTVVLE